MVALLSGCQGAPDVDGAVSVEIPGPDRAALVVPLEQYTVVESDFVWESYLVELLIEQCTTEAGLDFVAVRPEFRADKGEEHRRASAGFRTIETARECGYGEIMPDGLLAERAAVSRVDEGIGAYTESERSAFDACYEAARSEVEPSVFDLLACRESSGYDAARYQELWRLQQEVIEANVALFVETRDALEEARVRTREWIAELEADR